MMSNNLICGVDEAGRGPLAGRVFAAAVILNKPIDGINDSKKLSEKKRNYLYEQIINEAAYYSIATASVEEIDTINILQASLLAMSRAIAGLKITPTEILIDGNKLPKNLPAPAKAIIGGDGKIIEIGAASILAKVSRDNELIELDKIYPEYGFAKHKGYGTKQHLLALEQYGAISGVHRTSFAPVRTLQGNLF